ncbi:fas-binding factor 1 homolog isoform X2 [Engraulis encrasicolus]|uniref:fas-binding factor 1 homolog isoform X2 n=1 Tax=Engraulis encrasicolus TaxID=184585 RepID=UPI002FCF877E
MAARQRKDLRSSIDDVLGGLLDDDDPPKKTQAPPAERTRVKGALPSRSGKKSILDDDDFFSKLAEEADKDDLSDISEADPQALLDSMKDIDDMDADLFGSKKKPSSAPPQTKSSTAAGAKSEPSKPADKQKIGDTDTSIHEEKKPSSAPASTARGYKKFSFIDFDDPIDDLLDDLDPPKAQKTSSLSEKAPEKKITSPIASPVISQKKSDKQASPALAPKKRDELTFDEDDDLMDALGFDDTPKTKTTAITPKTESISSEPVYRPRTRLDEILGRGTSPRLLERPPTGEKKEQQQQQQQQQQQEQKLPQRSSSAKDPVIGEDDFTFGSYQPTLAGSAEGRQSRRQSVRFSTEDISSSSPERRSKPSTPATPTSASRANRSTADWLGLSQDDADAADGVEEMKKATGGTISTDNSKVPPSPKARSTTAPDIAPSSPKSTRPRQDTTKAAKEVAMEGGGGGEEEDWLAGALSRKKAKEEEEKKAAQQGALGLGDEVDLDSFLSKRQPSPTSRRRQEDPTVQKKEATGTGSSVTQRPVSPSLALSAPARGDQSTPAKTSQEQLTTLSRVPHQTTAETTSQHNQPQVTLSAENLQQLLLQQQLTGGWGLGAGGGAGGGVEVGALHRQRKAEAEHQQQAGEQLSSLQARIIQLEGQVRTLQLERDQRQMLLDSVQLRHKQDTELMENTHRARVKLLEESSSQRELRMRQEIEDLSERLATVTRLAEQERAELQTQHQRRLAQSQQDRDREVERLRDLQRKSILEMKKDHEEQVSRLKRLKDEEIDAVTSATSQTRSLTVVIEQMEQFSRRLGDLSSRVESTHEHTTQGLELGARQRDEQLRVMQDRLGQQQRAMGEERARLQEVIAKMDTQLAEQQRQLEKERWRVSAEQAKAESSLRGLDEEKRSMTQQISIEREELERAKSSLLEEQQQVMQRCAEERRKLAAEWAQFHTQEKMRQERADREASRAIERDAHREGSIISMAQEQAELKLRGGELKQREDVLARERETLDRLREDLEREKERLSATALRLKTRAQEVESFSKLASEKFEEGEGALQEARRVETEHQTRLRSIHAQMERLRQQEQHLHQERMRMTEHRRDMNLRQSLPINLAPPLYTADFAPVANSQLLLSPLAPVQHHSPVTNTMSPELLAKLAMLKQTAEKDRDFLQDEQFFLATLKAAPYNSLHTT